MKTTVSNPAVDDKLTSFTIQEFCVANRIVSRHPKVRVNANGYPFVTLYDEDNIAHNTYFSKALVEAEPERFVLDAIVDKTLMKDLIVVECFNADGELRVKFARPGGERESMDDLF